MSRSLIALFIASSPLPSRLRPGGRRGAVLFSRTGPSTGSREGGLFAVKDGHHNQLTENPADTEPSFSPDGRTVAFVRDGDVYSVRPDGSGQRQLTNGPSDRLAAADRSPNGRYRRLRAARTRRRPPADLYTVRRHRRRPARRHHRRETTRSRLRPGRQDDRLRPLHARASGRQRRPLLDPPQRQRHHPPDPTAGVDEFDPRYFAGGIVFSRGESSEGPAAYADIYTMRANGTKVKPQVAASARPTSKTSRPTARR